jgi:hypothetical protein
MAISMGTGELRHWSEIDLWSDDQRNPVFTEELTSVEDDLELQARRTAKVGLDVPLMLTKATNAEVMATVTEHSALLAYLASEADSGWSFHLARLACTFKAGRGEFFKEAKLTISLRRTDGDSPKPIAWSLAPDRLLDGDERTSKRGLTASAKLIGVTASEERKAPQGTIIQSYGPLTSHPEWRFTRTKTASLEGDFALVLIVRAPAAVPVRGEVVFDVTVIKPIRVLRDKQAEIRGASQATIEFESPGQEAVVHL